VILAGPNIPAQMTRTISEEIIIQQGEIKQKHEHKIKEKEKNIQIAPSPAKEKENKQQS
jgi:hypothetical protein